ncbi:cytochrome P450 [Aspergillus ruber CBS 135680]|uniref:Putative cytochrome P450 monooxygenase n=1 Tax=Aspergillus ruber (strain CBS 135680) TaxID=1388766 RepID=A0A017SE18_ASPRC|nr:putative cytochrome P450 monooxygenase [Aspergillus ruber CBS 135680]EYE95192.1 putative cytochrome P450 monooxygenase [Aspergillus ruber CBS 135680]
MARPSIHFGVVYFSIAALVYLRPEYRVLDSPVLTFIGLSIIATALRIIYDLSLYPQFFTPLKQLPTPPTRTWLRGNTKSIFLETPLDEMADWIRNVHNDGLIRYYMVGNLERVLLTSPKALSEVLVHKAYDFCKPELVQLQLRRVTGNGLLLAEGDEHKLQRKNLMPAFSYRHVKDLYPVFWAKSAEMANLIEQDVKSRNNPEDNVVQIGNWASRATLDIVGLAGMDHDFESLQDPDNELNRQYRRFFDDDPKMTRIIVLLGLFAVDLKILQKLPVRRNKIAQETSGFLRSVARQIIHEKREKIESKTENNGVDIISVALQSGTFTEENLVDQMMTFLTAGHETTSTAMQWAIYALCKHPDIQSRLREEIRTSLPSISSASLAPLSAATLDSLPYLNAVCNEVIRFYPSVPATVRIASRDTTITGVPIPKDTFFMISPHIINRQEEFWGPEAATFNPERWIDPNTGRTNKTGGTSNNYALLSFLHGPRSCIGQGFAKVELACLVATMVGKFEMELRDPNAKLEIRKGATVHPRDGVMARLTPLEGW